MSGNEHQSDDAAKSAKKRRPGRGGVYPPEEHQFKPGNPGGGRPKGTGITDRLREVLNKDDGEVVDALVASAITAARNGDFRFWKEIVDRIDGPVRQQIDAVLQQLVVEVKEAEPPK